MPSYVKCAICGGFGGEWGEAQGVGPMCYDCYQKQHKLAYSHVRSLSVILSLVPIF